MFTMGCDVGAMMTKTVLMDDGALISSNITRNHGKLIQAVTKSVEDVLSKTGVAIEEIEALCGTGRGEKYITFPHETAGLMNCLAKGARWALPAVRTIADMGGLGSTAIHVNEEGRVLEYRSNDRCAAGTGFFLELAANALELDLEQLGPLSLESRKRVPLSSQCAVFRESEIVTHINEGEEVPDIVAGINHSIGISVGTMVRRLGIEPEIAVTGGVAKNLGVVKALEENLRVRVTRFDVDSQLIGAIGAALSVATQ